MQILRFHRDKSAAAAVVPSDKALPTASRKALALMRGNGGGGDNNNNNSSTTSFGNGSGKAKTSIDLQFLADLPRVAPTPRVVPVVRPAPPVEMVVETKVEPLSEFNDEEYCRDVLELDALATEDSVDAELFKEASVLGIEVALLQKGYASVCDSSVTVESRHARTGSTLSQESVSTNATSRSSSEAQKPRASKDFSFREYDEFLEAQEPAPFSPTPNEPAPSLFSVSTRKSYSSIKNGIKSRLNMRRTKTVSADDLKCIRCQDEFHSHDELSLLPCNHRYCQPCLRLLIIPSTHSEDRFPPRCCSRGIPGPVIKSALSPIESEKFMTALAEYSTPWSMRLYCCNQKCKSFLPPGVAKINPKRPFATHCMKCHEDTCSICKDDAHPLGEPCPSDWDLQAVQNETRAVWKRCYKCRGVVEQTTETPKITCQCSAEFCTRCGAVWDAKENICLNVCLSGEELARRQAEEAEQARLAQLEKEAKEEEERRRAEELEHARQRTRDNPDMHALLESQYLERDRFIGFERKMKWLMWTRHGQVKLDILDKYDELAAKMRERHQKTTEHLENRQLTAEMEFRASLKQAEKSVQIRLRHMEAYCDGLGLNNGSGTGSGAGAAGGNGGRVVTERDLRELGQQYNIRDDLERLHAAKVNVMREKQSKQMEQLLSRQEEETSKLQARQEAELDDLEASLAEEEKKFIELFAERKERLRARWKARGEVKARVVGDRIGVVLAGLEEVCWPVPVVRDEVLTNVLEGEEGEED